MCVCLGLRGDRKETGKRSKGEREREKGRGGGMGAEKQIKGKV